MQQATNIARQMVTRWGMSDRLGPVTLTASDGGLAPEQEPQSTTPTWRAYSDDTARLIDAEIRRVLDESYASAVQLLGTHRHELDVLASALLVHETLDQEEILDVTGLRRNALVPVTATAPSMNNHIHASESGIHEHH
jgi:cell division protease FtsH